MGKTVQSLTLDEFIKTVDPECSCELVRGAVIELSPGGLSHGGPSANLVFLLQSWARSTHRGRTFTNEIGLITERDPDTLRGADVVYYSYNRLPKGETRVYSDIPPELVVEVAGRGQTWADLHEKAAEYLRMGVDRVWLVDPEKHTILVIRSDAAPEQLAQNDTLRDEVVLPGFESRVEAIFED